MSESKSTELYEDFHSNTSALKRVPRVSDFVMVNHLGIYAKYFRKGQHVLDIGCGGGAFSIFAGSIGALVKGVDISERAITENRKSAANLHLQKVTFAAENFMEYSDEASYDLIMMNEVLEHLPDDTSALVKVSNLLKQGGILLISVPSSNAPLHKKYLKKFGKDPFDERVGHLRRYDLATIRRLLEKTGFEVLEYKLCEGYLRNWLFNDSVGQFFMRFNRWFMPKIITFIDDTFFTPIWGESDIILATRKR